MASELAMNRRAAAVMVRAREVVAVAVVIVIAVAVAGTLASPSSSWAQAQRREGDVATAPLTAKLRTPVRFGDVTLPAGSYRVFVSEEGLTFADPQSMVTMALVPGQAVTATTSVGSPILKVAEQGNEVRITVQTLSDVLTVVGVRAAAAVEQPDVEYASKTEALINGSRGETSEATLIDGALSRYLKSIKHCGDSAKRNHWRTDDPRFIKCVCPIVDKWRLPKLSAAVRVDRVIVMGHAGLSLTAGVDGKARDCRVWVGSKPPAEPPPGAVPEPQPPAAEPKPVAPAEKAPPPPQ